MNKKFSTLVAALLLSGALCSVQAKSIEPSDVKEGIELVNNGAEINFTDDVDLENDYLLIDQSNVTINGKGHTLKGRIVITGENVTVQNLYIELKNEASNFTAYKNAITVSASAVTIKNNTITCLASTKKNMANGISIFPKTAKTKFVVSGNTFYGINSKTEKDGGANSAALLISSGLTNFEITGEESTLSISSVESDADAAKLAAGNIFYDCGTEYALSNWSAEYKETFKQIRLNPVYDKDGNLVNEDEIKSLITNSDEDSQVIFMGDVETFLEIVGNTTTSENVAVQCNDGNILYKEAQNPDNGKGAVIAEIDPLKAELFGYELVEKATSDYCMLILHSNNSKEDYAIVAGDEDNLAQIINANNINTFATNKKALWSMTSGKDSDGKIWYKFKNQAGDELTVEDKKAFYPENNAAYNNGVVFKLDGLDLQTESANYFGLYSVGYNTLAVKDLNWFESDGFSVTITCDVEKDGKWDDALEGDVFKGHLTPMTWNSSDVKFEVADEDAIDFYLKNEDGKYIVAKKYTGIGANDAQAVYTFDVVDEETLIHDLKDADSKKVYHGLFKANVSAKYTDYQKLEVIDKLFVKLPVGGWSNVGRYDLTSAEVPTLAASNATALKEIKVKFGGGKVVDKTKFVKAKFYTVTKLTKGAEKGYKLAVESDENYDYGTFVKSYGNELEGQWALIVEGGNYVFTNREATDCTWSLSTASLYYTDEENVYKYGSNLYKIETVDGTEATDGYETLPNVKANKFNLGYASNVFGGNAWFTENHTGDKNHVIGLDINSENALVFTAKEYAKAREKKHENHEDYVYPTDSIYVISTLGYYEDNTQKFKQDTLKIVSYSFVNQFNEPLVYNYNDDRYESEVYKDATNKIRWENAEEAFERADHFAIRKDNGKVNLRLANTDEVNKYSSIKHHEFSSYMKMYSGSTLDGMLSTAYLYNRTENDLFAVEPIAHTLYRRLQNDVDTISIYRDENAKSLLYEKTTEIAKDQFVNFLGMENIADFTKMAPAMIADTAYVRNETYRPQYMLVVDPKIQPEGLWCEKDSSATCPHAVPTKGWVEGRYLVNLKDTAIAWDNANKHKQGNPYINSEKHYKLGFVQAKHYKDSLIIASTNDSIFVGGEDFNVAKFAFRYVDEAAGTFVIETANYKELPNAKAGERNGEGYLKWMNGVVVVVPNMADADVYNMNEDEDRTPTANEGVEVSEVSVVAANGAVIVKGAAGKTVAISNILGQTIANTVVASDNATIAVPAGIVVVAVEGEEAVKVVVK